MNCLICKGKMNRWAKKYCSKVCQGKTQRGENSPNWVGDKVGYYGIHDWLYLYFGNASKCEQCGSLKRVQWAKLKGKEYERKRENFWQLCAKCHIIYDGTIVKGGWNKGMKWSKAVRKRISEGTKRGMAKLK